MEAKREKEDRLQLAAADSRGGEANVARGCPSVGRAKAKPRLCLDCALWQLAKAAAARASDQASRKGRFLGVSSAPPQRLSRRFNFGFRNPKRPRAHLVFSPKQPQSAPPSPNYKATLACPPCNVRRYADITAPDTVAPSSHLTQDPCLHLAHAGQQCTLGHVREKRIRCDFWVSPPF